ncbi:adenine DNA glycosylase-like [Ornithodoros turicata]|uniref:adenine DNA glycosylase-like n=1 Tax=Ornithodoros turicata TaxID=34597 RepID=UPI003139AC28
MPQPKKRTRRSSCRRGNDQDNVGDDSDRATSTPTDSTCPFHMFTRHEKDSIGNKLLGWYDKQHRQLPWRAIAQSNCDETTKGYAIWVSEVMLQQTQVVTVIRYYNKWMEKWPTVKALSEASLDEVFEVWAGLGYYQRARRLHEGAQKVQSELGGVLPNTMKELMAKIPGVGRYTAAAIASIAHGEVVGAVDGNVVRVLSRMRLIGSPVGTATANQIVWDLASGIVSTSRPGDFNQAMMELGATVCTPRNPRCSVCPLQDSCRANRMNSRNTELLQRGKTRNNSSDTDMEDVIPGCNLCLASELRNTQENVALLYPYKAQRKEPRKQVSVVLVARKQGQYLVQKRTGKGRLLEGLLEFPNITADTDPPTKMKEQELLTSLYDSLVSTSACSTPVPKYAGEVIHIFSHIRASYRIYVVNVDAATNECIHGLWMTPESIKSSGISTAMKKVLLHVENDLHNLSQQAQEKAQKSVSPPDPKQPKLSFTPLRQRKVS